MPRKIIIQCVPPERIPSKKAIATLWRQLNQWKESGYPSALILHGKWKVIEVNEPSQVIVDIPAMR